MRHAIRHECLWESSESANTKFMDSVEATRHLAGTAARPVLMKIRQRPKAANDAGPETHVTREGQLSTTVFLLLTATGSFAQRAQQAVVEQNIPQMNGFISIKTVHRENSTNF